ncbi:hypothetical protein SHI21_01530 [Bacteriovorax sp. PP10]|uniref:PilZ domain-containing protein n=1 Tax=Bacteriovorax antarcticus TaxID=3088717 RepID=A0ABU5VR25_9BACT|nr:hypothetical protein [Bacteriovorax sp. PP10]MEA9354863.1 hypothetical protein [Bacteriovorax sp. PP10]
MKVLKRNYEHRNLILFLIFSLVYLQAIYSLSRGESILNIEALKTFLKNHYFILAVNLITIFMVVRIKKHSDKMLLLCLTLIAGKNFIMLAASFNKLILGLNFVYLIFAFYFFVTWELEIAKASFNPLFSKRDLEKDTRFHLKGQIENVTNGSTVDVLVTNIDENGCFALIAATNESETKLESSAQYRLKANYEGKEFIQEAQLISSYDRGVGLEFKRVKTPDYQLDWSELYKVCLERGLFN